MDEVKEFHEHHGLRLEAGLVVIIRHHEKDVLQNVDEKALEEGIGCCNICLFCNIVNKLQAHVQTSRFNVSVVMLKRPRARVDDELELVIVQLQ